MIRLRAESPVEARRTDGDVFRRFRHLGAAEISAYRLGRCGLGGRPSPQVRASMHAPERRGRGLVEECAFPESRRGTAGR